MSGVTYVIVIIVGIVGVLSLLVAIGALIWFFFNDRLRSLYQRFRRRRKRRGYDFSVARPGDYVAGSDALSSVEVIRERRIPLKDERLETWTSTDEQLETLTSSKKLETWTLTEERFESQTTTDDRLETWTLTSERPETECPDIVAKNVRNSLQANSSAPSVMRHGTEKSSEIPLLTRPQQTWSSSPSLLSEQPGSSTKYMESPFEYVHGREEASKHIVSLDIDSLSLLIPSEDIGSSEDFPPSKTLWKQHLEEEKNVPKEIATSSKSRDIPLLGGYEKTLPIQREKWDSKGLPLSREPGDVPSYVNSSNWPLKEKYPLKESNLSTGPRDISSVEQTATSPPNKKIAPKGIPVPSRVESEDILSYVSSVNWPRDISSVEQTPSETHRKQHLEEEKNVPKEIATSSKLRDIPSFGSYEKTLPIEREKWDSKGLPLRREPGDVPSYVSSSNLPLKEKYPLKESNLRTGPHYIPSVEQTATSPPNEKFAPKGIPVPSRVESEDIPSYISSVNWPRDISFVEQTVTSTPNEKCAPKGIPVPSNVESEDIPSYISSVNWPRNISSVEHTVTSPHKPKFAPKVLPSGGEPGFIPSYDSSVKWPLKEKYSLKESNLSSESCGIPSVEDTVTSTPKRKFAPKGLAASGESEDIPSPFKKNFASRRLPSISESEDIPSYASSMKWPYKEKYPQMESDISIASRGIPLAEHSLTSPYKGKSALSVETGDIPLHISSLKWPREENYLIKESNLSRVSRGIPSVEHTVTSTPKRKFAPKGLPSSGESEDIPSYVSSRKWPRIPSVEKTLTSPPKRKSDSASIDVTSYSGTQGIASVINPLKSQSCGRSQDMSSEEMFVQPQLHSAEKVICLPSPICNVKSTSKRPLKETEDICPDIATERESTMAIYSEKDTPRPIFSFRSPPKLPQKEMKGTFPYIAVERESPIISVEKDTPSTIFSVKSPQRRSPKEMEGISQYIAIERELPTISAEKGKPNLIFPVKSFPEAPPKTTEGIFPDIIVERDSLAISQIGSTAPQKIFERSRRVYADTVSSEEQTQEIIPYVPRDVAVRQYLRYTYKKEVTFNMGNESFDPECTVSPGATSKELTCSEKTSALIPYVPRVEAVLSYLFAYIVSENFSELPSRRGSELGKSVQKGWQPKRNWSKRKKSQQRKKK